MKSLRTTASAAKITRFFKSAIIAATLVSTGNAANATELTIAVSNIKKAEGNLYIRVYGTDSQWLSQREDGPRSTEVIDLSTQEHAGEIVKTFELPKGTYAATAIHDINKNGQLDRDSRGIPQEPAGETGNGGKKQGPPTFTNSQFELTSEGATKTIRLNEY